MLKHYTDYDRNFMERLNDFLPEKIVDVHTHVWRKEFRIKRRKQAAADRHGQPGS